MCKQFVLAAALLLLARPANAQDTASLSLRDVIRLATATEGDAATALSRAAALSDRARAVPHVSLATTTGYEPDTGGIRFRASEQLVFDFGSSLRRLGELAAAQAQLASSSATLAIARRSAVSAAIAGYFGVLADQAEVTVQTQAVAVAGRAARFAAERFAAGNAPQIDVDRTRSILDTSQAELNAATSALADDSVSLGALVGRTGPITITITVPTVLTAVPDTTTVTTAVLTTNPNVASARAAYAAARAALLVARSQSEPGLSVGAGVGISRLAGQQQFGPAASVSIDVPLPSRLAKANVAAAQAAVLVAQVSLEQSQREAIAAALRARTSANAALARLGALQRAADAAGRVSEAELKAYAIGAIGGADLLLAQTQANAANAALANAKVQLAEAQAALEFEMGDFTS
jgi:outer membrane protein TolC